MGAAAAEDADAAAVTVGVVRAFDVPEFAAVCVGLWVLAAMRRKRTATTAVITLRAVVGQSLRIQVSAMPTGKQRISSATIQPVL